MAELEMLARLAADICVRTCQNIHKGFQRSARFLKFGRVREGMIVWMFLGCTGRKSLSPGCVCADCRALERKRKRCGMFIGPTCVDETIMQPRRDDHRLETWTGSRLKRRLLPTRAGVSCIHPRAFLMNRALWYDMTAYRATGMMRLSFGFDYDRQLATC